ncbi:hypothetical protein JCM10450v2_001184 [Rhodotorula kratochvilovae]
MRASQQQQTPLRWVLWGLFCLVTLYSYNLWATPPLGKELNILASRPGTDLEVLGIGRHSATVIFIQRVRPSPAPQLALTAFIRSGLSGSGALGLPLVERIRDKLWQVSFLLPSACVSTSYLLSTFDVDELKLVGHGEHPPMPTREDEAGMKQSVERIHRLIQGELDKGIDPHRIVLAGFSQGCAISLLTALSSKEKLGGVMCLSGWLPMSYKLEKAGNKLRHPMQQPHAHDLPVFWGHGDVDNVIAHNWAEESIGYLHKMGFKDVEFHTYPGLEHFMAREEEKDIAAWLAKRLPPT